MMHENNDQISAVIHYLIPSKGSIVLQAITRAILEIEIEKGEKDSA